MRRDDIENHMVIGDYYEEPRVSCVDEDAAYERWREENSEEFEIQRQHEDTGENMKLNQQQYETLTLVDDATRWSGTERPGAELTCYFVPSAKPIYSTTLKKHVVLHGAGIAATFKFLFRNNLVLSIPKMNAYACAITEKGMIALEEYRQAHEYVNGKLPTVAHYVKELDHDLEVNSEVEFLADHPSDSGSVGVVNSLIRDEATLLVESVRVVFPDRSEITLDRSRALAILASE